MDKKRFLIGLAAVVVAASGLMWTQRPSAKNNSPENKNTAVSNANVAVVEPVANLNTTPTPTPAAPTLVIPLAGFFDRITKKPFGIYITPKTSPVQPEKFTGYHAGADAETTAAEKDTDMPVMAVAAGQVVFAGHVNGYGGVVMIRHVVDGETVTALYGHLRISSITVKVGQNVAMNTTIAVLGTGYTSETDHERKHLHFAIIKGAHINYKGYAAKQSDLAAWEDPVAWLKQHGVSAS